MSKTCETCKHRGEPINTEKNMYWCECGKTCVDGSGWEGAKPMNELKPEDVMRALEHCANYKSAMESCIGCPLYGKCDANSLESLALALLREKDAEIERLEAEIGRFAEALFEKMQAARAEAITEFAEKLKRNLDDYYTTDEDALIDVPDLIDYIAKKMKGESHDSVSESKD